MDHFVRWGSWAELYAMLGTSSAALIGLLFVAASLHLEEIVKDPIYKIRVQNSTLILVGTLVQAAVILTPQPIYLLGIELMALNVGNLWIAVDVVFKARKINASKRRGGFSVYRAAFSVTTGVLGLAGSAALITTAEWGLYLVSVSYVAFLIASIWNAWNIMLGIGQSERKGRR
jgi:hypothetical protein